MNQESLKLEVDHSIRIRKPATEIFEAIVAPKHLNRYFTAKAEGRLEKGKHSVNPYKFFKSF